MKTYIAILVGLPLLAGLMIFGCSSENSKLDSKSALYSTILKKANSDKLPDDSASHETLQMLYSATEQFPKEGQFYIDYELEDYNTESARCIMSLAISVNIECVVTFINEVVLTMYNAPNLDSIWLYDYTFPDSSLVGIDTLNRAFRAWNAGIQFVGEQTTDDVSFLVAPMIFVLQTCLDCPSYEMITNVSTIYGPVSTIYSIYYVNKVLEDTQQEEKPRVI